MKSTLKATQRVAPTRRQAALLTLSGLALATTSTAASAAASDIRTVSAAQRAADQQTLLNLINEFRAQNGVGQVRHSAAIAAVMEAEAIRQFKAGYFSHGSEFYGNPMVKGNHFASEVIALSYNDRLSELMNFWKNSAPHRRELLSPQANVVAIGMCYGHGSSLPWRVLANVGIYGFAAGMGPNDYTSTITAQGNPQGAGSSPVTGAIDSRLLGHYQAQGGNAAYGQPQGAAFSSIGGAVIQNFERHRTIYWTPAHGSQTVYWPGAIGNRFAAQGFEFGSWGYPMNSEYAFAGGARQDFVKAGQICSVYWSAATGARVINGRGAIAARWFKLGGPAALGFPATDETRGADGVVRVTFSGGTTINWTFWRGTWES